MRSTVHRRVSTRDASSLTDDSDQELNLDHLVVRRKLHFQVPRDEDLDTCWGTTWKTVASFLLTVLLLGPFLHSNYRKHQEEYQSSLPAEPPIQQSTSSNSDGGAPIVPDFLTKADLLSCAGTNLLHMNTTYSQIYLDIKLEKKSMCRNADSKRCRCHNPTIPIMRNVGMKKGTWSNAAWRVAFERNKELATTSYEKNQKRLDVVLLGDSITEMWRGTAMNNVIKESKGVPELWKEFFLQDNHNALQLGVASDRSNNLLYRLQNGELPATLNPAAWWILIGTNDYMDNCAREAILVGIMTIVDEVLRHASNASVKYDTASRVVLNSLLPRGKDKNLLESNLWQDFMWVNDQLECLAQSLPDQQLSFFNGTSLFLTTDGKNQVNHTLMYDYLHPSFEGYKLWGHAILEKLTALGIWKTTVR